MKYIILIPSYEPDERLINLLKKIPSNFKTIIVNDGSSLAYKSIFDEAKKYAHVIEYDENMGKGHALKTGLKYINENYTNYIVITMDSDGQHEISDAIKLADFIKNNLNYLALGKRKWNRNTPLRSRLGNAITRYVYKRKTKLKIYDTQTGLRAFSDKLMNYMQNIPGDRFEYEMNVLLGLKENHIPYKEIPIKTIYIDNNKTSHFRTFKDSYLVYKNIFKHNKKD